MTIRDEFSRHLVRLTVAFDVGVVLLERYRGVFMSIAIAGTVWLLVSYTLDLEARQGEMRSTAAAAETAKVFRLDVGDCIRDPGPGTFTAASTIACDGPAALEVFHVFELVDPDNGGEYPGQVIVTDVARSGCLDAFELAVGMPYRRAQHHVALLTPTAERWEQAGERTVVCLLSAVEQRSA